MVEWVCVLELDQDRQIIAGSEKMLSDAVRRGADLRVGTTFRHNEHIDTDSTNTELVREVMDFRVVYLLENYWVAGVQNLRMPVLLRKGFGPRESMSFFLYNQDGHQAIARPYLDGQVSTGIIGPSPTDAHWDMHKYHELDRWDAETNAPSSNFIYEFDVYRFFVCDQWEEVYAHNADGTPQYGSIDALADASVEGSEVKVAVSGLCGHLSIVDNTMEHQVFVHGGSCYYYTEEKHFTVAAHPLVRVRPNIPLRYASRSWDFGWINPSSDGNVHCWLCDPYTLKFRREQGHYTMRWFVSKLR